jgi:hypothetical protein
MASSRVTATNENVSTVGAVSKDYSSLANWESATDNDLVTATQSEVAECYDDAATHGWLLNLAGATTDSSYFRIVRPASGEGHDGTPNNGVHIHTVASTTTIQGKEAYSSVQDLIISHTINLASGARYGLYHATGSNQSFIGCIVLDVNNTGAGTSSSSHLDNIGGCSYYDCLSIRAELYGFQYGARSSTYYNCTSYGAGSHGFYGWGGSPTIKNCLSAANSGNDFQGSHGTQDYNAASDNSANGANSRDSQTFTFVDSGNDDYQLASGDAGAKDYGTDLSGTFDDDLAGATWTGTWDIGCLQAAAAAAAGNPWYFYANQ